MTVQSKGVLLNFFEIIKASIKVRSDQTLLVKLPEKIARKLNEPEKRIFKIDEISPRDRFFIKIKKYLNNEEIGVVNCAKIKIKPDAKELFNINPKDRGFSVIIFNFKVIFSSSFEKHEDIFSAGFNVINSEKINLDTLQNSIVKIQDSKIKAKVSNLDELYKLGLVNIKQSSANFIEKERAGLIANFNKKVKEIEKCYAQMIDEGDEERASILDKIKRDESKYRKLIVKKDLEKIEKRLKNYKDNLEELDSNTYIERLNEEKEGKIKEQKHLHKADVILTLINVQMLEINKI